jgi:cytochrome c biogenesis protein CcmG/thiol:disulfide interchange protein DsbE
MPNGKIQDEAYFKAIQEGIVKSGNIKIEILDLRTKSDSIIKEVQFSMIDTTIGVGFDPYANHKKLIGSKFKIAAFKNDKNINYKQNYLEGKPSLINFWFTRCPPCISEIPNLNNLESKFKNKVNFIAITFDTKIQVDAFLKKRNINFKHIVNAQKQLDDLQIEAYPMSFLLDKDGKIVEVFGEISYDEKEILKKIDEML